MPSPLAIGMAALKNFTVTDSIKAGGAASILTVAIGSLLVALGVSVPFLDVPLTMAMVTSAALPIGHIVSALVPDSYNQQLTSLATKLQTNVENIKMVLPQAVHDYPANKTSFGPVDDGSSQHDG